MLALALGQVGAPEESALRGLTFMGFVGIVDPPDDMNLANPPSHPALLDYLTQGFVNSGYDMKWLHRTIATSDAYQRSRKTNETNELDRRNFSHALLRRLPAEVAMDAVALSGWNRPSML